MFRLAPDPGRALWRAALVTAAWLLLAPGATALPDDRQQPIRISADQALRDERQGYTEYTGNVRMQQGSLQIEAEKITVFHQQVAADRILAEGNPARMQQQPDVDKSIIHAAAQRIEYFKAEERVHLQRQARIEQEGSIVTGDSIDYYMAEQRVRADAGRREDGGRVEVVIPAQVLQDVDEDGATNGAAQSD
ncbi:lipopolysaccharide transport periplasmic protein LptA [Haliea sp. E1-2-M8]|uniref:lipopolysaccharide transport periplasmic protein LptA n=1 Tax=Haliea sp. E1-2-M8 TaxID=3064706 RepID=UPI002720AC6E|nr:lipopolysaccharide transport periplasmic protein LptA [Haliea sp. E1-2-M8]MDO8861362.1 lipopolysaccharide transport periplasmic protein LptA [Haliea sp. E1-2-M8]